MVITNLTSVAYVYAEIARSDDYWMICSMGSAVYLFPIFTPPTIQYLALNKNA